MAAAETLQPQTPWTLKLASYLKPKTHNSKSQPARKEQGVVLRCICECVPGLMDGWIDGWMNGCLDASN